MNEVGMINGRIDAALIRHGCMDLMLVSGAGAGWKREVPN